jgi:hypothetical protein
MSLQLIPSEFPHIWGKFSFIFYQCDLTKTERKQVIFISVLNELGAFNTRSSVYFALFSNLCMVDLLFCWWKVVFPPLTSWLRGRERWCPPLDSTAAPEVATRRPPLFAEGVCKIRDIELQTPSKRFRHYSLLRVVWRVMWEVESIPRICKSSYGGKLFSNIFYRYVSLNGFKANRYE